MSLLLERTSCISFSRTNDDTVAISDERATAGVDYQAVTSGIAIMADLQTSTTIPITILPVNDLSLAFTHTFSYISALTFHQSYSYH